MLEIPAPEAGIWSQIRPELSIRPTQMEHSQRLMNYIAGNTLVGKHATGHIVNLVKLICMGSCVLPIYATDRAAVSRSS